MIWRARRQATTFSNWAGNQHCQPRVVHLPTCEQDVVQALSAARNAQTSIKTVGAGHCWSDIACTSGHMLLLDHMNHVVEIDREAQCVTVEAGIRIEALNEALAQQGLALSNLGSMSKQTIAGAVATGTHGTGVRFGSMSTLVQAMRLVKADGEVVELSRADGDTFEAARLNLGCLGVVTRLTLRCEPAFDLEEVAYNLPFDEALDRMPSLVDEHDHITFSWFPYTDCMFLIAKRRVPRDKTKRRQHLRHVAGTTVERMFNRGALAGLLRLGAIAPSLVPSINQRVSRAYFRPRRRHGRADHIFGEAMPPLHREMEYGIPKDVAPLALRRLRQLLTTLKVAANLRVDARFVAHDSILLSPAYGRDSCQLGVNMGNHPHLSMYFDAFETLCRQLDGRPHWGKEFNLDASDLAQRLPKVKRFQRVRSRLDPDGLFANSFTKRVFGC